MNDLKLAEFFMLDSVKKGVREDQRFPNYWRYRYDAEPTKLLQSLFKKEYIQDGGKKKILESYTVDDLKKMLSEFNLKVSGSKSALVKRLLEEVPKEQLDKKVSIKYFVLSEKGQNILNECNNILSSSSLEFNKYMDMDKYFKAELDGTNKQNTKKLLKFIYNREYEKASGMIPNNPKCNKKVFDSYLDFNIKVLEDSKEYEDIIKSCVLFCVMIEQTRELARIFYYLFGETVPEKLLMRAMKYYYGIEDLIKAKRMNIPKEVGVNTYTIESMCDQKTCKECEKVQGKEYLLANAKLGINFPPLDKCTSEYCRCFPTFDIKYNE